ncbi:hypothetical protein [Streptomyces bikiniensis]|uniref:hypothetical protein n=1 Tax=Streptomyces bikiniensis TaxID=1896 RepID=UPI0004BFC7C0|nr:hypothetical protein [Streptomyces bikiniensis]
MKIRPKHAALIALSTVLLTACSSGQELSYGGKATGEDLEVTVLRVEQGGADDLSVLRNPERYAGRTPYYVHYRVTKTTDGAAEWPDLDVSGDEGRLTHLSIRPGFPTPTVDANGDVTMVPAPEFTACVPDDTDGKDFDAAPKGRSYPSCGVYLTDEGGTGPTRVEWLPGSGKGDPIAVWK